MTNDKLPKAIYASAADFVETLALDDYKIPVLPDTHVRLTRLQQSSVENFWHHQAETMAEILYDDPMAAFEVLRMQILRFGERTFPMYRSLEEALSRSGMDYLLSHLQSVDSLDVTFYDHPSVREVITSLAKQASAEAGATAVLQDNGVGRKQELQILLSRLPEIWMICLAAEAMELLPISNDDVTRLGQLIDHYGFSPAEVAEAIQQKAGIEIQVPDYMRLAQPAGKLRVVR